MKISSLAVTALILLGVDGFQPISSSLKRNRPSFTPASVSTASSTLTCLNVATGTDIYNATDTSGIATDSSSSFGELGLEYPPISLFGKGHTGTSGDMQLLGGKGANLAEMSRIGLSVPPGFTITTECCKQFCTTETWNQKLPPQLWEQVKQSVTTIEDGMGGRTFGLSENPLLLSVRSGAAISMPGMMDTVLNLGMNDDVVEGLAEQSQKPRFAWDSYRRFLEMFGNVVLEIPRNLFEDEIDDVKYEAGVYEDSDLSTEDLKEVVKRFKKVYIQMDLSFPDDAYQQLELAVGAVFKGWMGDRAVKYRQVAATWNSRQRPSNGIWEYG